MEVSKKGKMSTKTAVRVLCIALVLVLISCIGASLIQTDFGRVQVYDFKLPVDGGKYISATMYRPLTATAENPAPLIVASHGGANSKEMQDLNAVELSRRGFIVISVDRYYHGDSSGAEVPFRTTISSATTAMIPMVEYAWGLDYVDRERIGVTGHSMGGGSTWSTMVYFGRQYYGALLAAKSPDSDGGEEITAAELAAAKTLDKVAAGLPNAAASGATDQIMSIIHANVGVLQGQHDENGYQRPRGDSFFLPDDPEVLSVINSIMPEDGKLTQAELNTFYGNAENKTLRVFYNPPGEHAWQHFSKTAAADTVSFFETALRHSSGIAPNNQLWFVKELFNLLGMIGAFLFVIPFAVLLLRIPCFAGLSHEIPKAQPSLATKKSRLIFWGGWVLTILVSFVTLVPLGALGSGLLGPKQGDLSTYSWFLTATSTNIYVIWAIFNGLFALLWFWLVYRFYGKKNGVDPASMWGIRIGVKEFLHTLVLAICVVGGFFGLAFLAKYFFHTDFRFWIIAIKSFSADKLLVVLPYLPLFFVFYAANAISINCANRVEGQKEWVNLLICGLGNALGIFLAIALQYGTLFATGTPRWGAAWLIILFAIQLMFELFIAAYISRYLYRETGNVWLGAMVNCMIIVTISATNSALLIPLV